MSQSQRASSDIEQLLYSLEEEPEETIHVYVEEDRITFVKEQPETINSTPPLPRDTRLIVAGMFFLLLVALIVASVLSPQPDTSKTFTVTVQRYSLAPVHKSVTVTARATGKGYIAPTIATGTVTFYNGAIYAQIIPVGTILSGQDGVRVVTDEQATIPPAAATIPPTYGKVSVPAHALQPGQSGNIPAGDIDIACCVTSVIVQNSDAFYGGRDGQHFSYVTKQDVYNAARPLLTRLEAQTPQLFTSLALSPTCVPTVSATPPVGQRTTSVSVTATVSCTAVSYNPQSVQNAIHAYSSRFGQGTLTNVSYQVIAIGSNTHISFYVTATWTPFVARHMWGGK